MQEKKREFNENAVATIIGPGTVVTGEILSQGTVHIEGTVQGRVECEDTIVVQQSGQVQADLIAGQIIISGTVEGNIFSHERLEITNHGKVVGNITSPRISIADGVTFEGQCTMKPVGQAQPPKREGQDEQKGSQPLKEIPKDKADVQAQGGPTQGGPKQAAPEPKKAAS